jgi:hypothetical protein
MDESAQIGLCSEAEQEEHRCTEHSEGWFIKMKASRTRAKEVAAAAACACCAFHKSRAVLRNFDAWGSGLQEQELQLPGSWPSHDGFLQRAQ